MNIMSERYTVGVDFGTESGRAVVIRVSDGQEMGAAVSAYGDGVIDRTLPSTGAVLEPEWALQNPDNYLDVFRHAVPEAVRTSGVATADIVGIGVDFTSCTMLPTLADGTPLCKVPEFAGNPHAWVKLWKHHAAQPEADQINETARRRGEGWLEPLRRQNL